MLKLIVDISRYSPLVAGIITIIIGTYVLLKDWKKKQNIIFFLFCLLLCLWALGCFIQSNTTIYSTALLTDRVIYSLAVFFPTTLILLVNTFLDKNLKKYTLFCTLLGFILFFSNWLWKFRVGVNFNFGARFVTTPDVGWYVYLTFFSTVSILILLELAKKIQQTNNNQIYKHLFLSLLILIIAGSSYFLLILTKINSIADSLLNLNSSIFLGIFSLLMSYQITKHRLINVSVIIGKTLAIIFTAITYTSIYYIILFIYSSFFTKEIDYFLILLSCLYVILTGLTFDRLKIAMITTSQKLFVKGKYNYRQTLLNLTSDFQTITSVSDFVNVIQTRFLEDIETSTTHIFLPQEFENRKEISASLTAVSTNTKTELSEFDITQSPLFAKHSPETPVIFTKDLEPKIAVPLTKYNIHMSMAAYTPEGTLLCIILAGKKLTETAFNSDDYDLFTALTAQIPAHLMRIQATRVAAEMDVAQRIQTDILPKNPTLPHLELACFMAPADEVGGDYYDIHHLNNTSWIILGDVAGHGVASGLVMFMVQSIITTLLQSQPHITPSELNYLANIILCKNFERTAESRPMTLVTLSTTDGRSFQINGSHDGIFIYRDSTQTIESHRVDHFPFGIGFTPDLEKDLFTNDTLTLQQNDILLLCTDGITEAFKEGNPKNEQFGEERLIDLLQKNGHASPAKIQEALLSSLNNFTSRIYADDVTFLVIKAV